LPSYSKYKNKGGGGVFLNIVRMRNIGRRYILLPTFNFNDEIRARYLSSLADFIRFIDNAVGDLLILATLYTFIHSNV